MIYCFDPTVAIFVRFINNVFALFRSKRDAILFTSRYNEDSESIRITKVIGKEVNILEITITLGELFRLTVMLDIKIFQNWSINIYIYPHSYSTLSKCYSVPVSCTAHTSAPINI
jgi:hypothetical protein